MKLIDKDAVLAIIEKFIYGANIEADIASTGECFDEKVADAKYQLCKCIKGKIDTLEVKEVGVWKTVDNINPPQADRNKIYCVLSKNKYLLARVINHPQDEDLLQWKCTEFPFHRYDMCEGDKYMQIV